MLVCGRGEEGGGLLVAKVLPLFRIRVRGSNESQKYALLHYMGVTRSIDLVDETLGFFV